MPHGGGHIGGGHHGGGGGGGGGGYRHHHNHYGYPGNGGSYIFTRHRFHGWIWGGVGVMICIIVILSVSLSIRFAREGDDEKNYTPADTRIHSFSSFFCKSVTVSVNNLPQGTAAYVYHLDATPALTDRNEVQFNQSFNLDEGGYAYWHIYLYPNSNISYNACVDSTGSYRFFIIKGTSNFNSWKDNPSTFKSVADIYVSQSCETGRNHLSYAVTNEGHYYLVYYYDGYYTIKGHQSLYMERYEYSVPNNYLYECALTSVSPCTASVGFQSVKNRLLILMPLPSNVNWDSTTYSVSIACGPQAYGYIIVTLTPFVALLLCVAIAICTCCFIRAKRKNNYRPIIESDRIVVDEKPPDYSEDPPPYNPNYT